MDVHQQLRALLGSTRNEVDSVLERLDSGEVDPVELVALLESLALLDEPRAELLEAARLQASETRRRDEERSSRQFVLRALQEIGVPQTAGFLEDYVYARERIVLKSRGFGSLRRDENRAWRRRPGHRRAYIVPCLDADGKPVPKWMGRSDWPLSARAFVPGVEALWSWGAVRALLNALREEDDAAAEALYRPFVERHSREVRGAEAEWSTAKEAWVDAAATEAEAEIERLTKALGPKRAVTFKRLEGLDGEQQLWGVGSGP